MNKKKQQNAKNKKQCTDANQTNSVGVRTRSMTRMKINELNEDCLLEIFSYLSKRELVKIERVCKKWKELTSRIWAKETILNVEKIKKMNEIDEFTCGGFNMQHLENILRKCGQYVDTFDLKCHPEEEYWSHRCSPDDVVPVLGKYCKNLKEISFKCGILSREGIKVLIDEIVNDQLESLNIKSCYSIDSEQIKEILSKGQNINKFIIGSSIDAPVECFAHFERPFKKLSLECFRKIEIKQMEKILEKSPELELFKAPKCCTFKVLNPFAFREHLVHLIAYSGRFFEDFPESPLPFPNLRILDLNGDHSVENSILAEFHKIFPNLEDLDLSECQYKSKGENDSKVFDNEGIKELGKLSKLKSLSVHSIWFLKADALIDIAIKTNGNLERLVCYWCNKLRDAGMVKFVSLCPKLTHLDVSYGQRITNSFLDGLIELLPLRTTKEPLKLKITHSNGCNLNFYEKGYPGLEIEECGELDEAHFDYDESELEEDGYYEYDYYSEEEEDEDDDEFDFGIKFRF